MTNTLSIAKLKELVIISEQQENFEQLLQVSELLLARDPNNPEYILYKLKALDSQGKATHDLALLQLYAKMRSSDATAFLLLYQAYMERGGIPDAILSLVFALSIEPEDEECQKLLSNLLADVDPKYKRVKINILTTDRIGHLACEMEPWARLQQTREESDCLVLFLTLGQKAANPYLLELLKNVAHVIDVPFFYQLYFTRPLLLADEFIEPFPYDLHSSIRGADPLDINRDGFKNLVEIYKNTSPCLRIPEGDAEFGWQFLAKHGITQADKIVLLHVRDSAYLSNKYKNTDYSYHDFRDANIENCELAVNYLTDKGYKVIRIGSFSNQTLAISSPNYFDFCSNRDEQHGDFYEVFLLSVCQFFIGNFSGPFGVAAHFDTPTLVINGVPIQHPYLKYGRFIPKRLTQHGEQVNLMDVCQGKTLKEGSEQTLLFTFDGRELTENGYQYIQNTSEEILAAVIEMESAVDNRVISQQLTERQQEYVNRLPEDVWYKQSDAIICDSFLQAHPELMRNN